MSDHRPSEYRQLAREYRAWCFAYRGSVPSFADWMRGRDRVARATNRPLPVLLSR